ncbi:MAG: hypothetical protein AAF547_22345 [Actinomycetota bacterium]
MNLIWLATLGRPLIQSGIRRLILRAQGRMVVEIGPLTAGKPAVGTITLEARRRLGPAPIRLSLVGFEDRWELTTRYELDPYRVKVTEEIYRHEVTVDDGLIVEAGEERTVLFHVPTPDPHSLVARSDGRSLPIARQTSPDPARAADKPNRQRWLLTVLYDIRGPAFEIEETIELVYDLDIADAIGP